MFKNSMTALAVTALISGCAGMSSFDRGQEAGVIAGPSVTSNPTPYTAALVCTSLTAAPREDPIQIAIGKIPDLTGKFSDDDGGYKITQGARMMAATALQYLKQVDAVERIDVSVAEFEIKLAGDKVLGDGKIVEVNGKQYSYRPLISGSVIGSDYYITGGITELNYNIFSGGAQIGIENIGAGARQFVLSIGADLRIVNTRTLRVAKSVTLQKQVVGYETTAGVFRFFGSTLTDINAGEKSQEPIQLAVRSIIEAAVADLSGNVLGGIPESCIRHSEHLFYTESETLAMMTSAEEIGEMIAERVLSGAPLPEPVTRVRMIGVDDNAPTALDQFDD